jgi:hypothetical protein
LTPDLLGKDTDEAVGFWDEATTACPGLDPAFGFTKNAFSFIWDYAPISTVQVALKDDG